MRLPSPAWLLAALLWLARATCDLLAQPVPAEPTALPAWLAAHQGLTMAGNELLFFTALALGVLTLRLRERLEGPRWAAELAVAALGMATVCLPALAIFEGRLVYPILGQRAQGPEAIGLLLAVTHGGLHMVGLLFAATQLAVGWIAWRSGRRGLAGLSLALAIGSVLGTYPDQLGPTVTWAGKVAFSLWLLVLGSRVPGGDAPEAQAPC